LFRDEVKKIVYIDKEGDAEKTISPDSAVYVKIGGSEYSINERPNRIHCVLTDIENASRGKYDLRKNTDLFGKTMPTWQTENRMEADSINNVVSSKEWEPGLGYAGTAKFSLVEPSGRAAEMAKMDILMALKAVSTTTGIPIHWLAWPELMSNRATAENMMEAIAAATKKDRLIWEEAFYEIILKSMVLAVDEGFEDSNIIADFQVKLPLISTAMVKALSDTWAPLQQMDVISMESLRNKIPGINPSEEKAFIDSEEKEKVEKFTQQQDTVIDDKLREVRK